MIGEPLPTGTSSASGGGEASTSIVAEMRGVTKSYRRGSEAVHALVEAELTLASREVVMLVGPSGSGKTTLLNVICGWEKPDAGSIAWLGNEVSNGGLERHPWRDVAMLPQGIGLLEELSVRENVELPLRLTGERHGTARTIGLLDRLGLSALADREPGEISIGEQQRAGLARALILRPRLLLADEPTGHQDAGWARAVFATIRRAAEEGTACLVATHHQEAASFADRVVTIRDGRLDASVGGGAG